MLHGRANIRDPHPVQDEALFFVEIFEGIGGKSTQLHGHAGAGRLAIAGNTLRGLQGTFGYHAPAGHHACPVDIHPLAFGYVHNFRAEVIDKRNTGFFQDRGAEVRVAPRDGFRGIEHGNGLRGHQVFRGDPIQVRVVNNRYIAGLETTSEILGARVHPGRTGQGSFRNDLLFSP